MKNDLLNDLDLLVARIRREMKDSQPTITEAGDPKDPRDIGTKVEIVLSTFNSNEPIDAKVDTGAEMSSIRVNNLKINEAQGVCSFDFYKKNVTMGYEGFQAVKVGDATENRPVVTFNVTVPTKDPNSQDLEVKNVKFNLNEVEGQEIIKGDGYMDVLLGMNFINAGKFRVVGRATNEGVVSEGGFGAAAKQSAAEDLLSQALSVLQHVCDADKAPVKKAIEDIENFLYKNKI